MRVREANTRILRAKPQPKTDVLPMVFQLAMPRTNGFPHPRSIELYAGRGRKENASVTQSGTRFPNGSPGGKPIPESALRLGRSFRMTHQAETASRNPRSERVALSQRRSKRKAHPVIPPQTGTHLPLHLPPRKTCAPSIPKLGRRKPKRNRRRSI